jgi:hypothetical protein
MENTPTLLGTGKLRSGVGMTGANATEATGLGAAFASGCCANTSGAHRHANAIQHAKRTLLNILQLKELTLKLRKTITLGKNLNHPLDYLF